MPALVDLTNKRFGRLVAISIDNKTKWGEIVWFCQCDCGKTKTVVGKSLSRGSTRSCGCLQKEGTHWKHGYSQKGNEHELYCVWKALIQRCANPNNKDYHNYGGRGITICARWKQFEHFLTDMGERPSNKYSIDRINNNKGYYKANCRWATRKQQAQNSRRWSCNGRKKQKGR